MERGGYRRHEPERTALYPAVLANLNTFATDIQKGTYFVDKAGRVKVYSPNVKGGEVLVAGSVSISRSPRPAMTRVRRSDRIRRTVCGE